ncbi:inovirus Gp2 family protein [Providencia vermicola]|uniref:Inovirus Gp2 family protein n=1 Tax=Providencia stuartii TaxID=588 RepID=A0ABD5L1P1_PROST|nr:MULTISPECIES: inovirus Gp2 family protein [Providencia]ELR5043457.1 inovirus Gp2 family protein [Providencia rettgeri]MCR4180693.1 inovirus Gp2 family protein [Providencia vermicola]URE78273.1 inovirus Gp2 family protein [Providencia stuartii]
MSRPPHNEYYIQKINHTIRKSLLTCNRITAIRVDLRFPSSRISHLHDSNVITRFFESLKAKIGADLKRKNKAWKRNRSCPLFYVWAREFGEINNKKHYHVLLLLNKDVYWNLGDFIKTEGTLYALIQQAWCSAIDVNFPDKRYLVHIPDNAVTWLDNNNTNNESTIFELNQRCSYLAKEHTKYYGDGERSFGCSR